MIVTVTITDTNDNPIQDVYVTGLFEEISDPDSCITTTSGQCQLSSIFVNGAGKNGIKTLTMSITAVSGTNDEIYNPDLNVVSSISDSRV